MSATTTLPEVTGRRARSVTPARNRKKASLSSPRTRALSVLSNTLMIVIGFLFVVPLVWLVTASLDAQPTLAIKMPEVITLDNFAAVMKPDLLFLPLWNSVLLAGGTAVATVVLASLAAYPLSRYKMRVGKPFLYAVLFGTCLPITAIMVPVYSLFVQLNLIDSVGGTILFLTASALPIAIWMMKNFMDGVPVELEHAAWMDGAGSMRTLVQIVLPLMRPGIAVVFIFTFIQAWGNFFVPFVLLLSPDYQPAAVSIFNFFGSFGAVAYGQLAAYSIVYSLPVLGLYVLVQRGLGGPSALAGAVKG
ncbi:carbohydrate ABC transporter permease [Microbacterium hydrothermale]|mgnify:CR=1 FL=1|uniref:carbohydrate ABC transporter permease n=1 Tax=Microbacterium hydrothermale TaxID=857427 RepID=UPI00197C10AC|nr:carbohydrate ABC transporter permease [Microbacterium hydrothermale]